MSTVWFMVDDTDPRLDYSGNWSLVPSATEENVFDGVSVTGPVYNNTLHSATGSVTATFRFNGSSYLGVYGTQQAFVSSNDLSPMVTCSVDGEQTLLFADPTLGVTNNMLACRTDSVFGGLSPGEHELLINVTNRPNSTWYLDYITFESLADPLLDGEVLQVGNGALNDATNYSMLTFGTGWSFYDVDTFSETDGFGFSDVDGSTKTDIPHSAATMKFNGKSLPSLISVSIVCDSSILTRYSTTAGTSLTLYSDLIAGDFSSTAAYQVAEAKPVTFPIFSENATNQYLFTIPLSAGEHTVSIAFNGSQSGSQLDIDYFLVTSLTQAEQAALLIIKAVLGSIVPVIFLVILASIIWLRSRGRKTQQNRRAFNPLAVQPFAYGKPGSLMLLPPSKRPINTEPSDTIQSQSPTMRNDRASVNRDNVRTMKLEQRVVVLQGQAQRNTRVGALVIQEQTDNHIELTSGPSAEGPIIHTDSGLRLTGDLEEIPVEREEVPPEYTAN